MNFLLGIFVVTIEFLLLATIDCKVCQTEVCQRLVKELKIIMDNKVDPCDDFNSYICGNFDKLYSIPPGKTELWALQEIEIEVTKELKNLLDKQPMVNKTDPKTKAKIFYQSCLDIKNRNEKSKSTITQLAQSMAKGKSYEENLINLTKSGLATRILKIGYNQDPENPEYTLLSISKPGLVLSEVVLQSPNSETGIKQIHNYKKYMNSVLDVLGMWKNERHLIDEIIVFHTNIAKALPSLEDQSNPDKYNNKVSIKNLRSKCGEISWKNVFDNLLKGAGKISKDNDMVVVFSLNYITNICSLLKEYNSDPIKKRVLEMDLQWAAIDSVVSLGSENLVNISHQIGMDNFGITAEHNLWKSCLDLTSRTIEDIMGHMYITNVFQASKKNYIEIMIHSMRKSLRSVIDNITWMDSKTKEEALKKLSSMKHKIGYPDYLLSEAKLSKDNENVTMDLDEFIKNYINYKARDFIENMKKINIKLPKDLWLFGVHIVDAIYAPSLNEMIFPAAILRFPFYDIGLPISVNYGGMGMVLGHEMLHGFDTHGSKYDSKGSYRNWWTNSSLDEYRKKVQCIIKQYSGYSIENQTLSANLTIGEDIADNAGMRMAYMTVFSPDDKREYLTLPELDFTPEQLFFVSNARVFCSLYSKEALFEKIRNDVHTVGKYRINGPMSNMPEFSKAFKCDASKKMNRLEKCLVW